MTEAPGQPTILVSDRQGSPVDGPGLVELARATLRGEGLHSVELSISFVEDVEMADLHERYLDEPGPTDVLSFPLGDEEHDGVRVLGDVVIAPAQARRNNTVDPAAELRLLLVHGILHLLGYDHETSRDRTRMWGLQERYSGVRTP